MRRAHRPVHHGWYDDHGLWYGGSVDDHRIYCLDNVDCGRRNDPAWGAYFRPNE